MSRVIGLVSVAGFVLLSATAHAKSKGKSQATSAAAASGACEDGPGAAIWLSPETPVAGAVLCYGEDREGRAGDRRGRQARGAGGRPSRHDAGQPVGRAAVSARRAPARDLDARGSRRRLP
jgi:hypothetical protein